MSKKLRVAIRADASLLIGTGHIMRCMVLAIRLIREYNAEVMFIMREHPGNLIEFVQQKKAFAIAILPEGKPGDDVRAPYNQWLSETEQEDIRQTVLALKEFMPDWVLFDHYALGEKSHQAVKTQLKCGIAVIDDLAERLLACDVLIDHNCAIDPPARYVGLINANTKTFLGPRYAPFRDELLATARQLANAKPKLNARTRVFVFLGGGDVYAPTLMVLKALFSLEKFNELDIDVVIGFSCPKRDEIEAVCAEHSNIRYFCQTPQLGELMAAADLAIGTGGINSSERVLLRLPAITFALADNQKPGLACYEAMGCVRYLGDFVAINPTSLAEAINDLAFNETALKAMQQACESVIPLPAEQDGLAEICQYLKDRQHENR